jgi:diguanylate cyclase (GGDEF)-like protein
MKILVIEDSETSQKQLCKYVRSMDMNPVSAVTGAFGVDLFLKERPDLILLDIVMPDINGYEVARQIRQLETPGEWTPIIFLSSLNKDEDIEKGIASGGDDYLLKPVSEIVLAAKFRAMQRIVQMRQSLIILAQKLDSANHELKRLTSIDGLTGIANRRHFDSVLLREWRRAMRQGEEISILMCDVDLFKQYNDAYGHQTGDECLRQIAQTLTHAMDRGGDLLARYGGEEFIAVLPDTSLSGASFVAEQMRKAISQLSIAHPDSPFSVVTASFGVASGIAMPETDPQDLVGAADLALYKAKHRGRNRVCQTTSFDPQED